MMITTNRQTVEINNAVKDFLVDTLKKRQSNEPIFFCNDDAWCVYDSFVGTETEAREMVEATGWQNEIDQETGKKIYASTDELVKVFLNDCEIIEAVDGVKI